MTFKEAKELESYGLYLCTEPNWVCKLNALGRHNASWFYSKGKQHVYTYIDDTWFHVRKNTVFIDFSHLDFYI